MPPDENLSANLIYDLPSIIERLDLTQIFPRRQPVEVELGCGDASFLVDYAKLHPERNFIGVERLLGRLSKLDRKGRRAGLANLRGVRIESSYFLAYLLPPQSVSALHVYFPGSRGRRNGTTKTGSSMNSFRKSPRPRSHRVAWSICARTTTTISRK